MSGPYCWKSDEGLTHVLYDNYKPPSTGFGWSSLCNAVRLPIEGEHFELNENVTERNITCGHCYEKLSYFDCDDDSTASVNGCLVQFRRNEEDVIVQAKRACRDTLHHSLPFEPDSFTGNLEEQVKEVCSECWETYVDHQWGSTLHRVELCVEVRGDGSRSEYFAANAETTQNDRAAVLRLISENELEKDIYREKIDSITITPARNIDY